MHPLIDKKIVDTIRDTGKTSEQLPDRTDILEKNNLPYNREAENVIISGCQILSMLPHVLSSLSRLFDSIETELMVHICTGCYTQAVRNMKKETEVLMLPELIERTLEK